MVTQLLERVEAQARPVHFGRTLLTVLVGVFWLVGWLAGMAAVGIGFARAGVVTGWQDAHRQQQERRQRARIAA